ncbi:MAG: outer membrane protein assembly factor BamA [candidate division WOR-3 bacterium]|nr:outer membrane protein assembly factor BamA [candidate division WOR-3 bacterium]MCX7836474.1 outer membrane protein assembly factor BamA [candidate division WOR-3 bacterium]MDW8114650.1 outer membrane protein assembly factor BamA [candidate division WOR-3 bacterium]
MFKKFLISFFFFISFLFSQIIYQIKAKTEFIDTLTVLNLCGLRKGEILSSERVAEAIKKLYKSGLFSEIKAETTITEKGIILTFVTKDNPLLKDIIFSGNQKIKTKELKEKVKYKKGEVISEYKLFNYQKEILKLYKEKGFVAPKVFYTQSERDSQNMVTVTFHIDEGKKYKIRKIKFFGVKSLKEDKIKRKLVNREKRWYRKGIFKEEEFKKDLTRIIDYYKEKGFLQAKILDYQLKTEEDWLTIEIHLEEGKRFYVGEINFSGNEIMSIENLRKVMKLKKGDYYNVKKMNLSLQELYNLYHEEGFLYCQINPVEEIRNDTVDVNYEIKENKPVKIRLVNIEGNERTKDKVIRREIVTLPGDLFKKSLLLRSQRNIFNLGFFEDISVDFTPVDTEYIDLVYKVKEKVTFGQLSASVSYSQREKIVGGVEISQPNFLGNGQKIYLKLEKGSTITNLQLGFEEPYLLDIPFSSGFNLLYYSYSYDYYDKLDRNISFNFSYPLFLDYTRIYWGLKLGSSYIPSKSIKDIKVPKEIYQDTIEKVYLSPNFSIIRDARDYIFNPSAGSYYLYSFDISTLKINFVRQILDIRIYFPLFWKFSLMARTRIGYIVQLKGKDSVPLYEKFYLGGAGEEGIRGYPDRSISPLKDGYLIGGKAMAIFNLEYKLKLAHYLSFIAFFDCGNCFEDLNKINFGTFKKGIGVGVRVEVPMLGLIGFDLGYGFDREGNKLEPHFQFGKTF